LEPDDQFEAREIFGQMADDLRLKILQIQEASNASS
jgi:hypothetical protein